ncbi:MAG: RDD family protein, partial [Aquihabitans sp.]
MTATPAPPLPATLITDPTAIEGRRIAAWLVDFAVFLLALSAGVAATGGMSWTTHEFSTSSEATAFCQPYVNSTEKACTSLGTSAVLVRVGGSVNWPIIWLVCTIAYIVLQGVTGASPGKLLLGLRVVDVDGRLAGVGKSLLRTIV